MIQIDAPMPTQCYDCYLVAKDPDTNELYCKHLGSDILDWNKRRDDCPLKEVKHGKWIIEISKDGHQATYQCSECGHQFKWIYDPHFPPVFNYCQKCCSDMRTDE